MITPKSIRQGIVAALLGKTSCGARVYDSRMPPWQPGELPCITVYSVGHSDQSISLSAPMFRRSEQVAAEIIHEGSTDAALAAALDDDEALVQETLMMDPDWVMQFEQVERVEVQRGRDIESDKRRMASRITFHLVYVVELAPVVDDDFDTVVLTVDEPVATPEVVATYTLP